MKPIDFVVFDGDSSPIDITIAKNKKITNIELKNDVLYIHFENGSGLKIWDDGQSCCENRYMCTDDTLSDFVGTKLLHIEIKSAPNIEDYITCDEYHEIQFLEVMTSKGCFTLVTHNEHNGYYGGFTIRIHYIKGNI